MARNTDGDKKLECGLIILGNAGVGKSFICNLLLDEQRFESNYQSNACTTVTEHHKVDIGGWQLLVYNIPGLVEANQNEIDRNKREIMRAFEECPKSVVVFVWAANVGGRVQETDVIAFQALNKAYSFKKESLAFVVNGVDSARRVPEYEGTFLVTISNLLQPIPVEVLDTVFIDQMGPQDKGKMNNARSQLIHLLSQHTATVHTRKGEILLEVDEIRKERDDIRVEVERIKADNKAYKREIGAMTLRHKKAMEKIEKERKQIEKELEEETKRKAEKPPNSVPTKTLKCGGAACPNCNKCRSQECNASAAAGTIIGSVLGGVVGAIGFTMGPVGLVTSPLAASVGAAVGNAIDSHSKCQC